MNATRKTILTANISATAFLLGSEHVLGQHEVSDSTEHEALAGL